jgi:hypothetical protein
MTPPDINIGRCHVFVLKYSKEFELDQAAGFAASTGQLSWQLPHPEHLVWSMV